ncbi:hypothetical protein SODALDRAFT_358378 [Sodiomyces alkalinus F11]|uniref:Uncharacterized protein n=1 Tax=Sodiomyces alkalinus (strain CBS 110278 / VKM F-3762 / F11) TaxID=1314773 RepID=A0A3N2Q016_SODAK|nr:hypothetical protein SODALDRAFT_358378 [Sodiomyces alkalinus F11]ROT39955.1 hypothetical protein SODALDRAFT_358378 [Sodiomyces alkalinus F11]
MNQLSMGLLSASVLNIMFFLSGYCSSNCRTPIAPDVGATNCQDEPRDEKLPKWFNFLYSGTWGKNETFLANYVIGQAGTRIIVETVPLANFRANSHRNAKFHVRRSLSRLECFFLLSRSVTAPNPGRKEICHILDVIRFTVESPRQYGEVRDWQNKLCGIVALLPPRECSKGWKR